MQREIPHALYDIMSHILVRSLVVVLKEWAMKSGWITRPTRRSETARLHSKSMAGERSEGDRVLKMAAKIKLLPTMATSIDGTFMALVIMCETVSSPDVFCDRLKESINKLFSVMFRTWFIFGDEEPLLRPSTLKMSSLFCLQKIQPLKTGFCRK